MRTVLGIDAGGTSTRCVWLDETGRCLGFGRSGPGNPISAGGDAALLSLSSAVGEALASGAAAASPVLIQITMAGGRAAEPGFAAELPRRVGLRADVHFAPDLLSAYLSGRAASPGYLLLAGTGAVAGRVEAGALAHISDGLGWLIGDEGSGFWLGREAVIAVARAVEGRGPGTRLTDGVFAELGLDVMDHLGRSAGSTELLDAVYSGRRPVELARFAPAVLRADDDPVAADILDRAANALLATWRSVLSPSADGPTVLAGGVLSQASRLRDRVQAEVGDSVVVTDGLAGAGLLAMRALGVEADEAERERIVASLAALRASAAG